MNSTEEDFQEAFHQAFESRVKRANDRAEKNTNVLQLTTKTPQIAHMVQEVELTVPDSLGSMRDQAAVMSMGFGADEETTPEHYKQTAFDIVDEIRAFKADAEDVAGRSPEERAVWLKNYLGNLVDNLEDMRVSAKGRKLKAVMAEGIDELVFLREQLQKELKKIS